MTKRLVLNVIMIACYFLNLLIPMAILGGIVWCSFVLKYEKPLWDMFLRTRLEDDRLASIVLVFTWMGFAYISLLGFGVKCIVFVLFQCFLHLLWKRRKEHELIDDVNLVVTFFLIIIALIFVN